MPVERRDFGPLYFPAIATRAAIRAQPAFRPPPNLSGNEVRELIQALHVCAWCGSLAFLFSGTVSPDLMERCIRKAQTIVMEGFGSRPESVAALAVLSNMFDSERTLPRVSIISVADVRTASTSLQPESFAHAAGAAISHDEELLKSISTRVLGGRRLWHDQFPGMPPESWTFILSDW